MRLGAWTLVVAVAVLGTAVRGFDFHSDEAAKCATDHWGDICKIVNPKLGMMSLVLPKEGVEKIKKLLNGESKLPETPPPRDWLGKAADAIPESLMNMFGRSIIEECVKKHNAH